jgi:hypothetical protein
MPEFRVSTPAGNAGKGENPLLLRRLRWDSSGRYFPYMCAPGKSDDNKFWCSAPL